MPALTVIRWPMIPAPLLRVAVIATGSGVTISRDPTIIAAVITVLGGLLTLVAGQLLAAYISNRRQQRRDDNEAKLSAALARERAETRRLRALLRRYDRDHEPPA
jgi:hypothetical protein